MYFLSSKIKNVLTTILVMICISQTAFAAQEPANNLVVYWGGWEGMTYDLNKLPAKVTTVNLAFADINASYQVDTLISGYLTTIPEENGGQLQPSYINWTKFKFDHPNTKIILSFGGSTFESIWTTKLTAEKVDTIAQNIAKVVNRKYPAYKSNFASSTERLGEVTIDGVDLDVETGGARLTEQTSNNVVMLIQDLKKYLDPNKLITFTGFSVGADPNNSLCTVPGSVHCGEDIDILVRAGHLINWVNVMAYDAGKNYAETQYQTALNNYANYVGKKKTILGLDVQFQWDQNGSFQETADKLANKAAWQKANQFGGAMFWGVNVSNNPGLEQSYIDAIANRL